MFNMPELFAQNIGDTVLMGRCKYEKDGTKAPVEWIVFDKKSSGTVLLLTKYAMVANTDNHAYGTPGGMDTRDKIVLLSIRQAERYLNSGKAEIEQFTVINPSGRKDEAKIARMTPYAVKKYDTWFSGDSRRHGNLADSCGLRSPGYNQGDVSYAVIEHIDVRGHAAELERYAIRPALRSELNNYVKISGSGQTAVWASEKYILETENSKSRH